MLVPTPVLTPIHQNREEMSTTDVFAYGIGAVLVQVEGQEIWPFIYATRTIDAAKCNNLVYKRKLLTIVNILQVWHVHLHGRTFRY